MNKNARDSRHARHNIYRKCNRPRGNDYTWLTSCKNRALKSTKRKNSACAFCSRTATLIACNDRGSFDNSGRNAHVCIISLNDVNFILVPASYRILKSLRPVLSRSIWLYDSRGFRNSFRTRA